MSILKINKKTMRKALACDTDTIFDLFGAIHVQLNNHEIIYSSLLLLFFIYEQFREKNARI